MGDTIWLALQALGTFAIVIVLALWSSKRARQMLTSRWPRRPSALARATPDPQFRPDPEVTDPFHGTGAPPASAPATRPEVDGARAASVEHRSGVERLDGIVEPADGARRDDAGTDAATRPREAN